MYFAQPTDLKTFVNNLINGTALPTGSESPFKLKDSVSIALSAENGAEAELIGLSTTVSGGHWKDDAKGSGYIGNFRCTIKVGENTSFATLDVATVVAMRQNGNKAVLKVFNTPNPKDENKPYKNVRLVKGIALDMKDAKTIEVLNGLIEFADASASVTV